MLASGHILVMGKPRKRQHRKTFIREWRKHRGFTLDTLGSRIEMTGTNLSKIERGEQPYTQPVLEALADALNCSPADLIMRPPHSKPAFSQIWEGLNEQEQDQAIAVIEALRKRGRAA